MAGARDRLSARRGLLDNTIIIFTADHGHIVGEHGRWCMRPFYKVSAKIPLIIVLFKGEPRVHRTADRLAEFAGTMPTLFDLCDIPILDTVDRKLLRKFPVG